MARLFFVVAAAVFAVGCSKGPPAGAGPGAGVSASQSPTGDASKGPVTIRITTEHIVVDDEQAATVRPAHAPGVMGADGVPTYAFPKLSEVVSGNEIQIEADPSASVGTLRGVLVSVAKPGQTVAVKVGDSTVDIQVGDEGLVTPDDSTIGALLEGVAAPGPVTVSVEFDPCLEPPAGMVCIPGGTAVVGSKRRKEERPPREIVISTFYMDTHEVTIADFDACSQGGGCKRRINGYQGIMKPFIGPEQPAVPIDWHRARQFCAWAGKRLPSEWEWEKAARGPNGDVYPWGNDDPTCKRAIYRECAPFGCTPYPGKEHRWDCNEHATQPVGTFPPGHYGLYEMAGNGYEWTASAGIASIEQCGAACSGRDPLGPCDGAQPCNGTRVLRGGSWYWPKHRIRGAHRRIEKPRSHGHRLSVRCAVTTPTLTRFPPRQLKSPPSAPPEPERLGAESRALVGALAQDPIEDKKICPEKVRANWPRKRGGFSETTCRDPFPYLVPNEAHAQSFYPYVKNLGGGYVGVGSDQNLSYIAAAKSEYAWLIDYDPRVVRHNERLRALILRSKTPAELVERFAPDAERASMKILNEAYADDPDRAKRTYGFRATRDKVYTYLQTQLKPLRKQPEFGWLRSQNNYDYVRTLLEQGRIGTMKGDLLGKVSMAEIARAARELGVPIRVYYTSNAPSSWGGNMTPEYRQNVLGLPFDQHSVVLRTTRKVYAPRQATHWHYNVQSGLHFQRLLQLPGYDTIAKVLGERIPTDDDNLTILGLPSGV